jgi:hypothetical protein
MTILDTSAQADTDNRSIHVARLLPVVVVLGILLVAAVAVNATLRSYWWVLALSMILAATLELVLELSGVSTPVTSRPMPPTGTGSRPQAAVTTTMATDDASTLLTSPAGIVGDCLWISKSAHDEAQTEDGWALDEARGIVAVADGASSAYFSGEWARILTAGYVAAPPPHDLDSFRRWISDVSAQWDAVADQTQPATGSWWTDDLQRRGSYATFLGAQVTKGQLAQPARWDALAIGDACLVALRRADESFRRVCSFPVDHPDGFGSNPDLVATHGTDGSARLRFLHTASGELEQGDVLLLMTDAIAQWALAQESGGEPAWDQLVEISADEFRALVVREREAQAMVDDDVTLVRVRLSE